MGIATACDRMPLVAPSGSALTLVASTNVLPVNGATDVTAVILEGALAGDGENSSVVAGVGTPVHDGTVVFFTTTLGRIAPSEAETRAGRATVKLIADGRSGTATITAYSGAATNTLEVDIGAAAATRIAVTASPQTVPPTGGQSTISARVEDQQGNGLVGVPVSFTTTRGTLSSASVVSNDQGVATTTLTTSAETVVTATAGGAATALSGNVTVTITPLPTITVTPPPTAMVGVTASFSVTVGTSTVVRDVIIDFDDGTTRSLGGVSGTTQVGHLFPSAGVYDVEVTATSVDGVTNKVGTSVVVAALAATGVATPNSATAPRVGDVVAFTVTPAIGAAIRRYEWDFGDGARLETSGNAATHAYASAGSKVTVVRVVPTVGQAAIVPIVVEVKP
jgi:hypothetical protein